MNDGLLFPDDLDACHQLIAKLKIERDQFSVERDRLSSRLESQDEQSQPVDPRRSLEGDTPQGDS